MPHHKHPARVRLLLDPAWKFHRGDVAAPKVDSHMGTYHSAKAGAERAAAAVQFDDSAWRTVELPHDWQVEQPFDENENLDHGYKARGIAWYRRRFHLDENDRGRRIVLEFGAVATHCTVWVNGQLMHRNWCGYTPFVIDMTDMAFYGDRPNVVAVRVDADAFEGWWYEGAGIYRHTWLVKTDPLHIAPWGVFVNPRKESETDWITRIETTLVNDGCEEQSLEVVSTLVDSEGEQVTSTLSELSLQPGRSTTVVQEPTVSSPALWSCESPMLYALRTEVRRDGETVDDQVTPFGYRTIAFDADKGLFLNGEAVKLKGTCNHQDHAGVGVAVPDSVQEFRIRRLREMGSNAYRCAHNPPAPALLDACDRLGMLVMDENRNFGSDPEHLEQVRTMVLRDRNHPSVILWSLFNEEPLQNTPLGARLSATMMREIKKLDPSRPVTAAINATVQQEESAADVLDVIGINYAQSSYDAYKEKYPERPIVGSENCCAFSTRGVYETSEETFYFDSYDTQKANWGEIARKSWREVKSRDFIAGEFVWTGFDYRGEPSPHQWPCINSHWGIMDTCGFAKDSFYLYQAFWTSEPLVHLLPHWNWNEGDTVKVMAFSNCDTVELLLNDKSLGQKPVDPFDQVCWEVPWEPGLLRAVGRRDGAIVAADNVQTTGEAAELRLQPDRPELAADGQDAVPLTISAVDAEDRFVPTAQNLVTFSIEGPGRIIGVGNGDPTCHEADKGNERSLFAGLCQVIVQATREPGSIRLRAESDGLGAWELELPVRAAEAPDLVPDVGEGLIIGGWRMSPVSPERIDPGVEAAAHDVNTWERVESSRNGQPAFGRDRGFALYRAEFELPADTAERNYRLAFAGIIGRAEAYLNGRPVGVKETAEDGELACAVPADLESPVTVSLLVKGHEGKGGLTRPVRVVPLEE